MRLAYLVTHPIQYQAPLLRRIAREPDIDLQVFFASDVSSRQFLDPGFGARIRWDVPLLEGYKCEFLPAIGGNDRISFWRPFNYGLSERLSKGKFDALWIHGYMRWSHLRAMLVAKRLGMKVLIRDEVTAISARRGPVNKCAKRVFFAMLRRLVDGFMAIGTLNREYYRQNGIEETRIFLMPYAIDNAFFQSLSRASADRREELRSGLGLRPGRPVILYVGKMSERKRPHDLLEAYALLSPDGRAEPDPYLVYVGEGTERARLEARTSSLGWSSVKFLGFKNQSELPAYYDLCDVFVIPSVLEPWGLVVNEAMNAGRPIIASDRVGCAPDLVRDGVNGRIFGAGDIGALHMALRDVLSDPCRCRTMGQNSLDIIRVWGFEEDAKGLRSALRLS